MCFVGGSHLGKSERTGCCGGFPVLLWVIMGVFFLKTLYLAFWVIPLWDIQDEPGHYSYILDIANGKGLPVMGEATFDETVQDNWLEGSWKDHYEISWIAQHPPLYYLIDSLVLTAARIVTTDTEFLFRITRLLSIVSGTLALSVFYLFFFQVTHDKKFALFSTAAISLIPMFGYQSSGTTHDSLLLLLSGASVLYWAKFLMTGNIGSLTLMACFLSLAAVTKSTSLLLFVPMVGICFCYLNEASLLKRMLIIACISCVAMLLPGIWMLRSYEHYGVFLSTWHNVMEHFPEADLLKTNLHQYLMGTTIIENLYTSFFGEFGWTGRGGLCMVLLMKNSVQFMPLYYFLGAVCIFSTFFLYVKNDIEIYQNKVAFNTLIALLCVGYFIYYNIPVKIESYYIPILYAFMLSSFIYSIQIFPLLILENEKFFVHKYMNKNMRGKILIENKFIYLSLFVCMFYTIVFIVQLNGMYEKFHMLRADHGRYWFPVLSLLAVAYVLPVFKLMNVHKVFLFFIIGVMAVNEVCIYYYYVMPFFSR